MVQSELFWSVIGEICFTLLWSIYYSFFFRNRSSPIFPEQLAAMVYVYVARLEKHSPIKVQQRNMLEKNQKSVYTVSANDSEHCIACSSMDGKFTQPRVPLNAVNVKDGAAYSLTLDNWMNCGLSGKMDNRSRCRKTCVSESAPEFVLEVIHDWESWFTWPCAADKHLNFLCYIIQPLEIA